MVERSKLQQLEH